MIARVGYPTAFSYLDDDHEEIGRHLDALRAAANEHLDESETRDVLTTLVKQIRAHHRNEESIMRKYGYPGADLHRKYHELLVDMIDVIFQYFATHMYFAGNSEQVADHISNKLAEEMFVDQLFADFLKSRSADDPDGAPGTSSA